MKIAIDAGVIKNSFGRGLGVYTDRLYNALSNSKFADFSVQLVDAKTADLSTFSLLHYPSFDFFYHTLPLRKKIPTVVTIHDTIPLIYPKAYPPGVKGNINLNLQLLALKSTKAIITDSETSKKDIVRFLGVKASKVFPVYLGPTIKEKNVTTKDLERVNKKYHLPEKYVCYVGDVNYNKNLLTLCEVSEKLEVNLVIVGKKAVANDFDRNHVENKPLVALQSISNKSKFIKCIGFVDDDDLAAVMSQSLVYCQPSFYEGFGLPVLDAMTLGVPTLCAKTQALVEIFGGASFFVDPKSVGSFAKGLQLLLTDQKLRGKLSKQGLRHSEDFSWEKTAKETYEVYRQAIL